MCASNSSHHRHHHHHHHHNNHNQTSINQESSFSSKRCQTWFLEYTEQSEDLMGPEGMEKFCEDIGVEPENIVMLVLAWKLEADQMGFFSLQEWMMGMMKLQWVTQDPVYYLKEHVALVRTSWSLKSVCNRLL